MPISDLARMNIIHLFKSEGTSWKGRLNDMDFLSRIYDLEKLPSNDPRYENARDDIITHTASFPGDWSEHWVFEDSRFALRRGSDADFLSFLCETVHPIVRPDREEARKLVEEFNRYLGDEGYQIAEVTTKIGNTRYEARGIIPKTVEALEQIKDQAQELKAEHIEREIVRMNSAVEKDPEQAIGTAKDLVESVCKTILKEKGRQLGGKEDLSKLVYLTTEALELRKPDSMPKETKKVIDKIFGSLSTLVQSTAELRNMHGTGHGRDGKATIEPRYAWVAANAAATIALFLYQSYHQT